MFGFSRAQKHTVAPEPPIKASIFRALGVRQGMWVVTRDGVGIVNGVGTDGFVQVMLTNEDGTNKLQIAVPSSTLTQAQFTQIPENRRPSPEQAKSLGYR